MNVKGGLLWGLTDWAAGCHLWTDWSHFLPRDDFMSSYFVAFSNDSRDWTTLHDGYAEWVSGSRKEPPLTTQSKLLV